MTDAPAINHLKSLVQRLIPFFILSCVIVYVATDYGIQDKLFLGFVIAFTIVLMGITMAIELFAWLYSWLWNHLLTPNE